MDLFTWHKISIGCLLAGGIFCGLGGFVFTEPQWIILTGLAGLLCLLAFFVIKALFWRCPRCHKGLPWFGLVGKQATCPHCRGLLK